MAGSDHDPPTRRRPTRTDRTGACFPSTTRGRPSYPSRACANESLQPRAEGAACPSQAPSADLPRERLSRPSAREALRSHSRKYVEVSRLWQDQITIHQQGADLREPTERAHAFRQQRAGGQALSQPSVRQHESPAARRRRRASLSKGHAQRSHSTQEAPQSLRLFGGPASTWRSCSESITRPWASTLVITTSQVPSSHQS